MHTPSAWLLEHRASLAQQPRGARALDLACDAGRNTLALAELGQRVDAVDVNDVDDDRLDALPRAVASLLARRPADIVEASITTRG